MIMKMSYIGVSTIKGKNTSNVDQQMQKGSQSPIGEATASTAAHKWVSK